MTKPRSYSAQPIDPDTRARLLDYLLTVPLSEFTDACNTRRLSPEEMAQVLVPLVLAIAGELAVDLARGRLDNYLEAYLWHVLEAKGLV